LQAGLHPWTYLPEARLIASRALARAGDDKAAAECLVLAREWIQGAIVNVPKPYRCSFLRRNPVNRKVLKEQRRRSEPRRN